MINQAQFDAALPVFPFLRSANSQITRRFQQTAVLVSLPAGKNVFMEGDHASSLALVLSGAVRVFKTGRHSREITLYRFGPGESCILTVNAILNCQPFPANAVVEQKTEALLIHEQEFRNWVHSSDLWREFVFRLLSQRLVNVLTIVDDVVFRSMNARVASLLLQRSLAENPIGITHQEIASELGSSREVISRIMEGLTGDGAIRPARGMIEVLDRESLENFAGA